MMLRSGCLHLNSPYAELFSSPTSIIDSTSIGKPCVWMCKPLLSPCPRKESREAHSLLSCYLPAGARGGTERPSLGLAFQDTHRNHSFLETLHLLEPGGCSDKRGLCYIGSIRCAVQLEPRISLWELRGLVRKKLQSLRDSQAATTRMQTASSLRSSS